MLKELETIPRLSSKEALILDLLVRNGESYGLQLVDTSAGKLKRGTVYVTLNRMEEKGYVHSWQETKPPQAIGLPRRIYQVTGLGERLLRAWTKFALDLAEGITT